MNQQFENVVSHFSSKRNHYKIIENFSRLSERDIIKKTSECSWINHCEKEAQDDCFVEIFWKSDSIQAISESDRLTQKQNLFFCESNHVSLKIENEITQKFINESASKRIYRSNKNNFHQ